MLDRLIISGTTGAIGSYFVKRLTEQPPLAKEIVCLVRCRESVLRFAGLFDEGASYRLRPIVCDLSRESSVHAAMAEMPRVQSALGIHLAADVSWDRTLAELSELNINGSLRFAEILSQSSCDSSLIYVSSAYASPLLGYYRNGYEESKVLAEQAIGARYPDLNSTTFSCSLVAGHSRTGEISSFHGVYPLFRFIESFRPPFVVGDPDKLIDTVPLDWTVDQLIELVRRKVINRATGDVVAAAGDRRIRYADFIRLICATLAAQSVDKWPGLELQIVSARRWKFLMRSMKTWQVKELCVRRFSTFEKLVAIYSPYVTDDRVLAPKNTTTPSPDPSEFVPHCIHYWLAKKNTPSFVRQ